MYDRAMHIQTHTECTKNDACTRIHGTIARVSVGNFLLYTKKIIRARVLSVEKSY